jgi:tetratricopeptide (TPR) repeat protein
MAMSALASTYVQKVELGYLDANEGFARARQLAQQAIELNPESAYAHINLQYVYLAHDWDWAAAAEETQRALQIDPMNPYVLKSASRLSATLGQWDTAIQQLRTALTRDPLDDWLSFNLGFTYYRARRFAEAETTLTELLDIAPDLPWTRNLLGPVFVFRGKPQEALVIAQEDPDEAMRLVSLPIVLRAAGRHEEADKALLAQIEQWGDSGAYFVALTYAHRDDHDRAFEWLERAYKQKDPALIEVYGNPFLDNLADDPRFDAFLQKMKLPEWPKQSTVAAGT